MTAKTFRRVVSIQAAEDGKIPGEIELLQTGEWNTPWHGHFTITSEDLAEYMQHAKDSVRKALPIDLEHDTIGGAVGWLGEGKGFDFEIRDNEQGGQSLWASVAWTKKGEQLIADREYRFFSPEFADEDYEDPEQAGTFLNNVLIGGGLTNRPLFKNLTAVAASDGTQKDKKGLTAEQQRNIIYLNEESKKMNLQELLAKDTSELTAEEKAFIVEHKDELTDEQVTSLTEAGVFEAEADEDDDEDKGGGDDDDADDDDADDDNKEDEDAKEAIAAAEKAGLKVISASELEKLQADSKAGRQASEQLARKASEEHVASLVFNEKTGGKLPTTAKDETVEFYHGLSDKQKKAFDKIVEKMPDLKMFAQVGDSGKPAVGSAVTEVRKAAKDIMAKDAKVTMASAIRTVLANDKELKQRYNDERKGDE